MALGVALIGSGIFVREEHLPAVQACSDLTLKAIYSRSLKSAKALAETAGDVDVYSDDAGEGKGYDDILKREDVKGVIIALTITTQPSYIRKALSAGKYVLSEKPIAKDLPTAHELYNWYHASGGSLTSKCMWGVAENFRFMDFFIYAAEQIQKMGRILGFSVKMYTFVKGGKYFETPWRKTPEYQGGFLDGGVHFVAGLRLLLGHSQTYVKELSAYSTQLQPHLLPVDTVDATMKTNTGITGTFSASFGTTMPPGSEYTVACEQGSITVLRGKVIIRREGKDEEVKEFPDAGSGVVLEVDAWAKGMKEVGSTELTARQDPRQALADLEILEAMLKSGEKGGAPVMLELQDAEFL